jgi:hypothetical protein
VEYTYDVYDRRIAKTIDLDGVGSAPAQTERFVYDGEHIALVFDENGELSDLVPVASRRSKRLYLLPMCIQPIF